jgi:hypothetical protein
MSPADPIPTPFDPSRFTPKELAAVRGVVHAASPERFAGVASDAPFDPSLYTQAELGVIRELILALRASAGGGPSGGSLTFSELGAGCELCYDPPPPRPDVVVSPPGGNP